MESWSTSALDWYDTLGLPHYQLWCSVQGNKKFMCKRVLFSLASQVSKCLYSKKN